MNGRQYVTVSAAVEGDVDEVVARRLVTEAGGSIGAVYGKNGKTELLQRIKGFNKAAERNPWLVLVDLDHDGHCAPPFRQVHLSESAPWMCFRIAVREVETWLMADRERFSRFLGVQITRIPTNPERIDNPKQFLVNLARISRRRDIQLDIVPRTAGGRQIGPAYSSRLIEFVSKQEGWRPEIAAQHSESLNRALSCLRSKISRFISATAI